MKILMLTNESTLMDGINRHILAISSSLNRRDDMEIAVCSAMPEGDLHVALKKAGVKSFALGFPNGHCPGIIPAYIRVMGEFRPDIVHCHILPMMTRIISSISYRRIPHIITWHGIYEAADLVRLRTRAENILFKIFPINYKACCYVSEGLYKLLQDKHPAGIPAHIYYNAIPFGTVPAKEHALHKTAGLPPETPIIGTACRILDQKNPQAFTRVMCKVLQAMPDVHAVVMGEGAESIITECNEIISEAKVKERFHWLGYLNNAPRLIRDLDCYIMTSRWEGLPTAILESMAMKTPVAMMKGDGGLRDLAYINEQEGPIAIMTEQDDTDGLAEGIISLLRNPERAKAMTENAYRTGKQHFDIEKTTDRLIEIYRQVYKPTAGKRPTTRLR